MKKIKVYDIEWDLEDEETGREVDREEEGLPTEIELEIESASEIAEALSNEFGFCVKGFSWTPIGETAAELASKIKEVLGRYFECDDDGNPNPEYDEDFTAQEALDEIKGIVGRTEA